MQLATIVSTHAEIARLRSRNAKIERLAACLQQLNRQTAAIGVPYLCGQLPQGRIGLGPAVVARVQPPGAQATSLSLVETDARFDQLGAISGPGSSAARIAELGELLALATAAEQTFLRKLILGELRQGALDGVMIEAVAKTAQLPVASVRKAVMLTGDLATVAQCALLDGASGLSAFRFELFRPVQAMLAQPAESAAAALSSLGSAALEYKLDGARLQVHRNGGEVRAFTRQLHDVTARVPEIVDAVLALPVDSIVLDGEAIAFDRNDRPLPFQVTMRRFGRRAVSDELRSQIPLNAQFFDCLYADNDDLLDAPAEQRQAILAETLPEQQRVHRRICQTPLAAEAFLQAAIAAGHEGIMAKSLTAPYQAGNRGADWLKIKPTHTLDLVILAAEWGSGRRTGKLSNLHLGAVDPVNGGFVMLGKTFKGLTDKMLAWQTEQLLARELGREGNVVHVRPELVVEVAFNELQRSQQYPGGVALRFARVKRHRDDKQAGEADTVDTVMQIYQQGLAATFR